MIEVPIQYGTTSQAEGPLLLAGRACGTSQLATLDKAMDCPALTTVGVLSKSDTAVELGNHSVIWFVSTNPSKTLTEDQIGIEPYAMDVFGLLPACLLINCVHCLSISLCQTSESANFSKFSFLEETGFIFYTVETCKLYAITAM